MKTVFFKQYSLYLPRWWFAITIAAVLSFTIVIVVRNIGSYLSVTEPANSTYLVVEGWQDEYSLKKALELFQSNNYKILLTTGGAIKGITKSRYKSYADYAAAFFLSQGIDEDKLVAVPTPDSAQNRTFLSAVMVRKWFEKEGVSLLSVDVFTEGVHARRTKFLYELAFKNSTKIGIYSSIPQSYNISSWWTSSEGAKSVITEIVGLTWVSCCFFPGDYGSHQEMWGIYDGIEYPSGTSDLNQKK